MEQGLHQMQTKFLRGQSVEIYLQEIPRRIFPCCLFNSLKISHLSELMCMKTPLKGHKQPTRDPFCFRNTHSLAAFCVNFFKTRQLPRKPIMGFHTPLSPPLLARARKTATPHPPEPKGADDLAY